MPSLFRIDSNSLANDSLKPTSVVQLPGFEDLVEQKTGEKPVLATAEEVGNTSESTRVKSAEDPIARKRRELEQVQKQIVAAQEQAKAIVDQANVQAQKVLADAQQKGYEDGFAQATASVRTEQEKDSQLIEGAVVALKKAQDEIYEQVEDSVLNLALYIAESIIKIKLDENDETFINILRNTLSKVQYQNNLIVNVSKAEYERLFADPNSEIVQELANSGVAVKQDLSLKSGECIVETEFGNINSGIKTQLKRLGYAMEEAAPEQ